MTAVVGPLRERPRDNYRLADVNAPSVIVSGMIAATPGQGGAAWAVLQYLLGLRRLGCEVHFMEPVEGRALGPQARYADQVMTEFGFDRRWASSRTTGPTRSA